MIYPVIIVGGGFSGLCLMNQLIERNVGFLLFEKNDRLGKKILATGNGRGNISNADISIKNYHGKDPYFAEYALKIYDNRHIAAFFEKFGVLFSEENGRLYPLSRQANTILDALRLSDKTGSAIVDSAVTDIVYDKKSEVFTVTAGGKRYQCENVVLCVGGKAAPHFGTDGGSYCLAEKFGHKTTPLYPSLVQLTTAKEDIKGLKGVKENASVSAVVGKNIVATAVGDILFSDTGISGNTVFYLSAYFAGQTDCSVKIDYVPEIDVETCVNSLIARQKAFPDSTVESILSGLVHSRISLKTVNTVLGANAATKKYKDLSLSDLKKLAEAVKNTKMRITGNLGFSMCQVTRGGIETVYVDDKTMESKLRKGLYFCGEVLDIDGNCGGYNLQWAYSSAMCVADSICEKVN